MLVATLCAVGLTAAQAAEILDASPSAVYSLVSRGALAKPVKHQQGGLQLDDVERASLGALPPRRATVCRSSSMAVTGCTGDPSSK
jgi:hypothetical protein